MTDQRLADAIRSIWGARSRPPAADLRQQLQYLERDMQEVRSRVNALFFTVITVALGDLVGRVIA